MSGLSIEQVNALDRVAFVIRFGGVYEHSPWVAEAAWEMRPHPSIDALHVAMQGVVLAAARQTQMELICAHPELRGKIAAPGALTDASRREQAGARLNACSAEQHAYLAKLNAAYREKFGFPFIVAVRGLNADDIVRSMRTRSERDAEQEFLTCLEQIGHIARFRLADLIAP